MKISLRSSGMARDLIPAAVGVLAAGGTALGLRAMLDASDPKSQTAFVWAPAIGVGVSLLAAGVIYSIGGAGPAVSTGLVGAAAGLALIGSDMIQSKKAGAVAAVSQQYSPNPALTGIANLAAVVPEYSSKLMGILWETQGMSGLGRNEQQRGEKVALHGVDSRSFGTRSYS